MGGEWTEERVREELPEVQVRFMGRIYTGTLSGRKLQFAKCRIPNGVEFEVSWETVANCLNSGKAIRA